VAAVCDRLRIIGNFSEVFGLNMLLAFLDALPLLVFAR
jgi:hypothetical protein